MIPIGHERMLMAVVMAGRARLTAHITVISQAKAVVIHRIAVASFGFSCTRSLNLVTRFEMISVIFSMIGSMFFAIVSLISLRLLWMSIDFHSAVSAAVLLKSL